MKVWVTRPIEDAIELGLELEVNGHDAMLLPLMSVRYLPIDLDELGSVKYIVVTSRHGLRGLKAAGGTLKYCDRAVFTVGEATARQAREMGFETVFQGEGVAKSLVALIEDKIDSKTDRLVHLRGKDVAFDLKGALATRDITLDEQQIYEMDELSEFSSDIVDHLLSEDMKAVILMSPRMARLYVNLMQRGGLSRYFSSLDHVCLSDAVAGELSNVCAEKVHIASRPTKAAIITVLNGVEEK